MYEFKVKCEYWIYFNLFFNLILKVFISASLFLICIFYYQCHMQNYYREYPGINLSSQIQYFFMWFNLVITVVIFWPHLHIVIIRLLLNLYCQVPSCAPFSGAGDLFLVFRLLSRQTPSRKIFEKKFYFIKQAPWGGRFCFIYCNWRCQ